MDRFTLLSKLPAPQFKKVMVANNQTAKDIIKEIRMAQGLYAEHYKLIADEFKGATVTESARNVWNFLRNKVKYVIERDNFQSSKSPAMFLTDGKGDCKHFSLFTVGILTALGYKCKFRFTSYKLLDSTPQHVYSLVLLENGQWMPVDGVIDEFGVEKPYTFKEDYSVDMTMYRISGVDDAIGRSAKRQAKKEARKQQKTVKKTARKAKRAERKAQGKGIFRKIGKGVAKISLTPVRAAYTTLLGLNARGMAKRLNEAIVKNPEKVKSVWVGKFKGNWNSLLKAVARGSRKGKKFTPGKIGATIGEPVTFGAAMAAAAPVLIAMAGIIKDILGKGATDEDTQMVKDAVNELSKDKEPSDEKINNAVKELEKESEKMDKKIKSDDYDYSKDSDSEKDTEKDADPGNTGKTENTGADGDIPPSVDINSDTIKIIGITAVGILGLKALKII